MDAGLARIIHQGLKFRVNLAKQVGRSSEKSIAVARLWHPASLSASVPDSALPLPSVGVYLLHDHHGWWKCNRVAGATLAHAVVWFEGDHSGCNARLGLKSEGHTVTEQIPQDDSLTFDLLALLDLISPPW